jgi:hypothetical protein
MVIFDIGQVSLVVDRSLAGLYHGQSNTKNTSVGFELTIQISEHSYTSHMFVAQHSQSAIVCVQYPVVLSPCRRIVTLQFENKICCLFIFLYQDILRQVNAIFLKLIFNTTLYSTKPMAYQWILYKYRTHITFTRSQT